MPASPRTHDADERSPLLSHTSSRLGAGGGVVTQASTTDGSGNDADSTSSFSCRRWVKNYVPIEVLLFGFAFSRVVVIVLTGFFYFDEASHMYGDPSMNSLNPCGKNHSGGQGDRTMAENVQKESLQLTMIGGFTVYMTAVLPTLFLGPFIDRYGRRLGFVLPLLGMLSRGIVFLFVLGTGASVYFVYIGTFLEGLSGGFGTFLMTAFSVAADVTEPGRQRALRICIIEAVNVIGSAVGILVAGQWRRVSYTQPIMLAVCVGVVSLVFALWGMPETHKASSSPQGATPEATTTTHDGEESREPLTSAAGKVSAVSLPQGGSGQEAAAFRGSGGGGGRGAENPGLGGGVMEHVGINYEGSVRHEGGLLGSRVTESPGEEAAGAGHASPIQHSYISFSPTGHRLSNPVYRSMQRQCSQNVPREDTIPEAPLSPFVPPEDRSTPSPPPPSSEAASCCSVARDTIRKSWAVYFRTDDTSHPGRRSVLVMSFVCFLLTVAVNFSKPGVEKVIRLADLCWDAVQESEFDSGWLVQHWVFILATLHVLQRRLKARDVTVAIVGCVSALCAPFIFSMAVLPDISNKLANVLVFVSAGSGTLARVLIPMLRSMSSAVVSLDEQGALFASYACVELAGAAVADLAAMQIYSATVHVWKGIIFLIMTAIFVVVLVILITLSVMERRWQKKTADTERQSP